MYYNDYWKICGFYKSNNLFAGVFVFFIITYIPILIFKNALINIIRVRYTKWQEHTNSHK